MQLLIFFVIIYFKLIYLNVIFYSYFDEQIQGFIVAKYLSEEEVIVDSVRQCGDFTTGQKIPNKATITIRVQVKFNLLLK